MYYSSSKKEKIETPLLFKIIMITAGFIVGLVVLRIFVTPYRVGNGSMMPNYAKGTIVLIHKHITPRRGDVVLYRAPHGAETTMLKRVIALPGETVEVSDKVIFVNGQKLQLRWKALMKDSRSLDGNFSGRDRMAPLVLGKDDYFMLGDNTDESFDSRETGPVKEDEIVGRVFASF